MHSVDQKRNIIVKKVHKLQNGNKSVGKRWNIERTTVLNPVKRNGPVNLIGDGRCNSPNAKYCTYTMMTDEGKVASFNVVQVTEVTSSNAMEKEGFERCIQDLQNI